MTPGENWAGSCNLRDLGGLRLPGGLLTAPGRLFRSGNTDNLTPAGWQSAAAAGVRTVVDLRNADDAVLFHCSAGKDRTGLIAALLLTLNGVLVDDVLDDYVAGLRGFAAWQAADPGRGRERQLSARELDEAIDDRVRTLADWLSGLGVATLLTDQVGMDAPVVARAGILLHPGCD